MRKLLLLFNFLQRVALCAPRNHLSIINITRFISTFYGRVERIIIKRVFYTLDNTLKSYRISAVLYKWWVGKAVCTDLFFYAVYYRSVQTP